MNLARMQGGKTGAPEKQPFRETNHSKVSNSPKHAYQDHILCPELYSHFGVG